LTRGVERRRMGTFFRSVCEAVRADGRGRACPENYGGSDVYARAITCRQA